MSKNKELMKKDDVVQAVLVADDFSENFKPLTNSTPLVLLPLVNKPIIEYTLEFLALGGVEETFVFCSSHSDLIKEYINDVKKTAIWAHAMAVKVLVSESCSSLGDCLRDVDAKGVIRGNFILVEPGVISNIKLLPLLQEHIATLKQDKGATMTLVMQETGLQQSGRCPTEDTLIVTNEHNQVLLHRRWAGEQNKIKFPLEMFMEHIDVNILHNIRDTHISICGPSVLPLFADNFDYQTRWDFIRGIMMVDEVDDSTIYCHILKDGKMGAAVTSWNMYQSLSSDIIAGWFYPINHKIQLESTFRKSLVQGENCKLSSSADISDCVLGNNVIVGERVILKNCIIFSNVIINHDCNLHNCIIGNKCIIGKKSSLSNGTILGDDAVLKDKTVLNGVVVQSTEPEEGDFEKLGSKLYKIVPDSEADEIYRNRFNVQKTLIETYDDGFETTDSEDESYKTTPVPEDDTKMFFNEVTDSLARGIEDKLQCNNLILEINSSRYAYNVSLKEVNYIVSKAILSLPFQLEDGSQYLSVLRRCLLYFVPILKNYIRDHESMLDCLQAVEDVAISNIELNTCLVKVLNWLYDKDFLTEEAIIVWFGKLGKSAPIHSKVLPFIQWLQEAEEESSEDED